MPDKELSDKVIVALDVATFDEAFALLGQLSDGATWFKVGNQLFTSIGPDIIREIKGRGKKLFLDLKFHDIPNTVARASEAATELGVDMFNIHVSGGMKMMRDAAEATKSKAFELGIEKPIVLGVTILTSIDAPTLEEVFGSVKSLQEQIVYMAKLAQSAGLDGVVASPQEIRPIRKACGDDFVIVTPGVRPEWASVDDQKRIMTPLEAVRAGASYIVIGRPIRQSQEPASALERIFQELAENFQTQ